MGSDKRPPEPNGFTKRYRDHLEDELSKARALYRVAESNGFLAPPVLGSDPDRGTITFGRLDGLVSLRELYRRFMRMAPGSPGDLEIRSSFRQAGEALAHLHLELACEAVEIWAPPPRFVQLLRRRLGVTAEADLAATPQVVGHGDYGFGNVHVPADHPDMVVVLDASPNEYLTFHPLARTSIYLDLGHFSSCLQGLIPWRDFVRRSRPRLRLLRASFLAGYESVAACTLDRVLLAGVAYAIAGTYLHVRFRLPGVAGLATWAMFWHEAAAPRLGSASHAD